MSQGRPKNKRNMILLNTLFCLVALGILMFLINAPEKSTTPLPHNDDHQRFYGMKKKEAEQYCLDCNGENGVHPLSPEHPSK